MYAKLSYVCEKITSAYPLISDHMNNLMILIIAGAIVLLFFAGIRIVRPTHRGLIERFGKYNRFAGPGFHWIIPVIDKMYTVNVTEQMVDAEPQEIITNDNLNAKVDAQVYFRVKSDEESVKGSIYHVNNYKYQIVNLARTTLRQHHPDEQRGSCLPRAA